MMAFTLSPLSDLDQAVQVIWALLHVHGYGRTDEWLLEFVLQNTPKGTVCTK
jgi:hypothetical protein